VLDFGIAKVIDSSRTPNAQLTSTGAFLGTPHYMAPERFLGQECDEKADVYSVGVVLYAALAGRLPFEGNLAEIMMQAVSQRPRELRELAPTVPEAVADVVMRCLEDDPKRRPAAAEVADALVQARSEKVATGVSAA
jgi:serine/threonine protein kinase